MTERTASQRKQDFNATFNSDHGKRVLAELLTFCHTFEPLMDNDPNKSLVREGRRDVATYILMGMKLTPADLPEVIDSVLDADG